MMAGSARALACALVVTMLVFWVPAASAPRPISIVLNGERLPVNPAPRDYQGELLVPVRPILIALGLDFQHQGRRVVTHVGYKTVTLTIGSARADVDGEAVMLDRPAIELNGVLFAPLRFFTDVLGAQADYDNSHSVVHIVAQLIGRSGNGITQSGNHVEQVGTITAVDVNSDPPTVTITYNASVRTVQVARNADILLQDVNANVTVPGELTDVHPGDFAHLFGGSREQIDRIVDAYGSRIGTVAAVAGGQMVLSDGHVVVPQRTTVISINGVAAPIDGVRAGDRVTVRYNVNSGDIREILVSRAVAVAPATPGSTGISAMQTDATRPLRAGQVLLVSMHGTRGGAATFDIGPYVTGIAMTERGPGTYTGSYQIPAGANFADVPVIGHLRANGSDALAASATISAASTPPGIGDLAPNDGATVNSDRPAIYATFVSEAVGVDPSTISLEVNGRNITSSAVRNANFIEYTPGIYYAPGLIRVTVRVADYAGNWTTKSWSFTIK
jgi:hypothetical protein